MSHNTGGRQRDAPKHHTMTYILCVVRSSLDRNFIGTTAGSIGGAA
jgi:hypothetical protein